MSSSRMRIWMMRLPELFMRSTSTAASVVQPEAVCSSRRRFTVILSNDLPKSQATADRRSAGPHDGARPPSFSGTDGQNPRLCSLGKKQGARLVTGGHRRGDRGFSVEPTIFDNVADDMAIARDEYFGPVVSVLPFPRLGRSGQRANCTYYGLAAAIWTQDIDKAHLYAKEVEAGTVWVNCYHVVDTTTPFDKSRMFRQRP